MLRSTPSASKRILRLFFISFRASLPSSVFNCLPGTNLLPYISLKYETLVFIASLRNFLARLSSFFDISVEPGI